jgi:NAD(P)-dependent dehydrogenase (short-subunit alcohol dehydrogenase family)
MPDHTIANRFADQVAVITGGAAGIGLEIAARITREGGRVSLWDRDAARLDAARAESGAAHAVALDIADAEAVAAAAIVTAAALGKIDILVCSAGITGPNTTVADYPVEDWRRVIDVNLNGIFYCNKFVVPLMERNGYGRIVNIASIAGKEGNPNASAYSASKAAVIGLTKSRSRKSGSTA